MFKLKSIMVVMVDLSLDVRKPDIFRQRFPSLHFTSDEMKRRSLTLIGHISVELHNGHTR